jgi:hypothetical protein
MKIYITITRKKKPEKYFVTSNWWKALRFWIKCIAIIIPKIKIIKYEETVKEET